jgi:hypothetical protein
MTRELDEALGFTARTLDDELLFGDGGGGKLITDSPAFPSPAFAQPAEVMPSKYGGTLPPATWDNGGGKGALPGVVGGAFPPPSVHPLPPPVSTMPAVVREMPQSLRDRGVRVCVMVMVDGSRQVMR